MEKNMYGGLLVAIDGPNGAGKSSLIELVVAILSEKKYSVLSTKEPTKTILGLFVREIAETTQKYSLACLVAADRYQHLSNEIIPHLINGDIVIMDRYVLSSLALQRMDNVDLAFILDINSRIVLPDVQVLVIADEKIIQERLSTRPILTRFEKGNRTAEELSMFNEGTSVLYSFGVDTLIVDNGGDLTISADLIIKRIMEAL
jgi:dTMP kinase